MLYYISQCPYSMSIWYKLNTLWKVCYTFEIIFNRILRRNCCGAIWLVLASSAFCWEDTKENEEKSSAHLWEDIIYFAAQWSIKSNFFCNYDDSCKSNYFIALYYTYFSDNASFLESRCDEDAKDISTQLRYSDVPADLSTSSTLFKNSCRITY